MRHPFGMFGWDGVEGVVMLFDQLMIRALISLIANQMHSYFQVRQHFERSEAALFPISGVVIQSVRSPKAPGRRLTVYVQEIIIVVENMIGDAFASGADFPLLLIVGRQII